MPFLHSSLLNVSILWALHNHSANSSNLATSNASAPRKKRRLSSVERDDKQLEEDDERKKRSRQEDVSMEAEGSESLRETPMPQPENETTEVKEVTEGVAEVDLDSDTKAPGASEEKEVAEEGQGDQTQEEAAVAPESVPLPEEDAAGELENEEDVESNPTAEEPAAEATLEQSPIDAPATDGLDKKESPAPAEDAQADASPDEETKDTPAHVDPTALALPASPKASVAQSATD